MGKELKIISNSPGFKSLLQLAERVARSLTSVLLSGESGTGKEVIARFIHQKSNRSNGPFVPINCSAIPDQLLESELFGHMKGSFTGALFDKAGLFEEANGGTLFLDEIGDLNYSLQAKLLRVLQEKKLKRVGENTYRAVNIRLISATNRDLVADVRNQRFREDLFYRLNVVPLKIPPLRERPEDILPLADYFLQIFLERNRFPPKNFSAEVCDFLKKNKWNGNVRELENFVERAITLSSSGVITMSDLLLRADDSYQACEENLNWISKVPLMTLRELNFKYIEHVMKLNQGAKDKSSQILGIDRKTLYRWMQNSIQ